MAVAFKYSTKYYLTPAYNQVLSHLISLARRGKAPIGYKYIFEALGLKPGNHAAAQAGQLLGEICQHMHQQGKPMLSALVINLSKGTPGDGFFELAVTLGRLRSGATEGEKMAFWKSELRAIYATSW
jgi:hypothetical protein